MAGEKKFEQSSLALPLASKPQTEIFDDFLPFTFEPFQEQTHPRRSHFSRRFQAGLRMAREAIAGHFITQSRLPKQEEPEPSLGPCFTLRAGSQTSDLAFFLEKISVCKRQVDQAQEPVKRQPGSKTRRFFKI